MSEVVQLRRVEMAVVQTRRLPAGSRGLAPAPLPSVTGVLARTGSGPVSWGGEEGSPL